MPEELQSKSDLLREFLLLFTKELILNSGDKVDELEEIIEEEQEKISDTKSPSENSPEVAPQKTGEKKPQEFMQKEKSEPMIKSILSKSPRTMTWVNPPEKPFLKEGINVIKPVQIPVPRKEVPEPQRRMPAQPLRIPEPRLPPEFQYLRPVPLQTNIDLGPLNPLLQNRTIQAIECEGPGRPVIISGAMGRKLSEVALSDEDIKKIIQIFSSESKIPADAGVYKVVVGRLIFSAVISDVVPSRFMIRKMQQLPPSQRQDIQGNQDLNRGIFPGR